MQKDLGIVISTMDSPSTSKVNFVCIKKNVFKGEYVQIDYSQGKLIGLVTDVVKKNRYFENNESVKEFDNNNVNLSDQFPTDDWEFLEAIIKPLGVLLENGMFSRATTPVSPGSKVFSAHTDVLSKFLNLKKDGLNIGSIEHPELEVKIDLDKLFQKHLAILAQSGAGKSYLSSVLIEEILNRREDQGQIATVLFDTHGEYSHFAEPVNEPNKTDYSSKTIKIDSKDIKIGCTGLNEGFFATLLPNMSNAQKISLSKAIHKLSEDKRNGMGPYGLREIIKEIENIETRDNVKNPLVNSLLGLENYRLFSKIDTPSILDIVKPNKLTIIDLSKEINQHKKQIILYYFSYKLFYARTNTITKIPPFLLMVEEAHQFAPEHIPKERALAKSILETIAREGRKFGASVCLISQRPIHLSTTILSQANTHIILRITNPYDLNHIAQSSEGLDQNSINMVTSLRVGEGLIVGEACSYPVFLKIRKKKSIDSKLDVSLTGLAKDFLNKNKKEEKDVESFL